MEKRIKISARFDPALVKRIDAYASKRYLDRPAAIQQLVSIALREVNKKEVVRAYREGRLTIRQCADMLGVDCFEMNEILHAENVPVISGPQPGPNTLLAGLKNSFGNK